METDVITGTNRSETRYMLQRVLPGSLALMTDLESTSFRTFCLYSGEFGEPNWHHMFLGKCKVDRKGGKRTGPAMKRGGVTAGKAHPRMRGPPWFPLRFTTGQGCRVPVPACKDLT